MKFNNNFAEQVKAAVDIVRVISEYVRLRKAGANYVGLCPFHSENTPSFHVHQAQQFYHCFGCNAGGDVFKFIQSVERITFPESLKFLAEKYGIPMPKADFSKEQDSTAKERLTLLDINQKATKVFKHQVRHSSEGKQALQYLMERGLSEKTIDKFDIGYAPSSSNIIFHSLSKEFPSDLLIKSGLVLVNDSDSRYYDRFRKRIIFPIQNESGKIIAFGGRILGEGQPKYLNSPETLLYSKSRTLYGLNQARETMRREDFAILVEGYMDCIALHQAGVTNAVASCGTSLTDLQAKLLSRFAEKIVVNFDPDSAGAAATLRSLNILLEKNFGIKALVLPGGADPDSFVKRNGVEAYRSLLERAPSYFDYLLDRAHKDNDVRTVEGKIAAVNMMLPYLVRISNRIERVELTARLSEFLGIEESILREELRNATQQNREKLAITRFRIKTELRPSEKYLLKAILENDQTAGEVLQKLSISQDYIGLQSENIFREIITMYHKEGKVSLNVLEEKLQSDLDKDFLNQALFVELDHEQALRCLEGIQRQKVEQEIVLLQKQIKRAELSQDFELLASLHSKKSELKRMMAS